MNNRKILPEEHWSPLNLQEIWQVRELVLMLVWRDITARYRQTIFGVLWAIIQPTFAMLIFTVIFGSLFGAKSDSVAYPLFSYAALMPWMFFANGLLLATSSISDNRAVISKVYFPRIVLPLVPVLSGIIDFLVSFCVLLVLLYYYQETLTFRALWIIPLLILTAMIGFGLGMILGTLNAIFHDVQHGIPYVTQLGLFVTPVAYPLDIVEGKLRILVALNPMTGIVEGFRWALYDDMPFPANSLLLSCGLAVALLVLGGLFFRQKERQFVDII